MPNGSGEEFFETVTYQGKTISVGNRVVVRQAGQKKVVEVSGIRKNRGHYWVGYNDNKDFCPWPLVSLEESVG